MALTPGTALRQKRSGDGCDLTDTYKANDGLVFDTHCHLNYPGSNILDVPASATDFSDCVNQCSISPGSLCYGVAYQTDTQECFFKNSDLSLADRRTSHNENFVLGVARRAQLKPLPLHCPYSSGSIHKTPEGQHFEIRCSTNLVGHDICDDDKGVDCSFWHSESLDDCMELCTQAKTPCAAVVFDPTLKLGYANCYEKSSNDTRYLVAQINPVTHTAIALQPSLDSTCTTNDIRTTNAGKNFRLSCNENYIDNDIEPPSPFHTHTLDECLETCVRYNGDDGEKCIAVVWVWNWDSSFNNCWLKSSLGPPTLQTGIVTATLIGEESGGRQKKKGNGGNGGNGINGTNGVHGNDTGNGGGKSIGGSASDEAQGSGSQTWIAGPVIGTVAAAALLLILFYWWRQRRAEKPSAVSPIETKFPYTGADVAGMFSAPHRRHCEQQSSLQKV